MTASQSRDFEDEIRAVPLDRLAPSQPARVLAFPQRLTDMERWNRLSAADPRSAEMIRSLFQTMYAFHFPDDE